MEAQGWSALTRALKVLAAPDFTGTLGVDGLKVKFPGFFSKYLRWFMVTWDYRQPHSCMAALFTERVLLGWCYVVLVDDTVNTGLVLGTGDMALDQVPAFVELVLFWG